MALESKSLDLETPSHLVQSLPIWTPTRLNLMALRHPRKFDNPHFGQPVVTSSSSESTVSLAATATR